MILQYEVDGKEIYREGETIAFARIVSKENGFESIDSVLDLSEKQIKYSPKTVEVWPGSLFDKEKNEKLEFVKMVILSDSLNANKNTTMMFAPDVDIYLLSENGKTLKTF